MKATDHFEPPIPLAITGLAPKTEYETPDDIVRWFQQERDWALELRNAISGRPGEETLPTALFSQYLYGPIEQALTRLNSLILENQDRDAFETAVSNYTDHVNERRLIYSGSRIGRFISDLSKTDPNQALRVAVAYCGYPYNFNQTSLLSKWAQAAAIAVLVDRGIYEK